MNLEEYIKEKIKGQDQNFAMQYLARLSLEQQKALLKTLLELEKAWTKMSSKN